MLLLFFLPLLAINVLDGILYFWIAIEIQTLFFVLHLWNTKRAKKRLISFLLIQIFSRILVFSFVGFSITSKADFFLEYLLMLALLLKMGIIPFHGWALSFISDLELASFFIFSTFIKLIPFYIYKLFDSAVGAVFFLFNMRVSLFYIFNVNSFKEIIFFSSLFLGGVILILATGSNVYDFLLFFFIYSFGIFLLIQDFSLNFSGHIFGRSKEVANFSTMLSVLALLGMPFSLGFAVKLVFLQSVSKWGGVNIIIATLTVGSVVLAYHYIKILQFYFVSLGPLRYHTLKIKNETIFKGVLIHLVAPFIFFLFALIGNILIFYLN